MSEVWGTPRNVDVLACFLSVPPEAARKVQALLANEGYMRMWVVLRCPVDDFILGWVPEGYPVPAHFTCSTHGIVDININKCTLEFRPVPVKERAPQ